MRVPPDADFLALQQALAGRYSLDRELGRGGMGIVYLAREVRLDRLVALKLLPPDRAARPDLKERFLREARAAARLSHPNIVPIHAVDEVDGLVFFVMAYVDGETLGERIRRRGVLPAGEATRILREAAWALTYAHAQGVVHRDVKPDNILIEAGSGRVLVTDFGIAQVADGPESMGPGEMLGTAEYMSPEQAAGGAADARSDLYGLGVVGYYMLSGRLPFHGGTAAVTLAGHLTQPLPPLAGVAPEVPRGVAQAVERCLAKSPAARYAGGEELAAALTLLLDERREVPAVVRGFAEKNLESSGTIGALGLFSVMMMGWMVAMVFLEGDLPWVVPASAALLVSILAVTPVVMVVHAARGLLRAGYRHEDLVAALRADLEARKAELGPDLAPSRLDRWLKGITIGGLGALTGICAWLAFGPYAPWVETVFSMALGPATLMFMGGGFTEALRRHLRGRHPGEPWLAFWKSAPGRWTFRLAGVGLEAVPDAAGMHRPTEMVLGMAAQRLFEQLPEDLRARFGELPEVVHALEAHAEATRDRVGDLDRLLAEVGSEVPEGSPTPTPVGADKREAILRDLGAARYAAEARLAQVVAALESVRLELLRLHAGEGSPEGLTADLGSAGRLAREVEGLVQGRRAVDAWLGRPAAPELRETPTPA